MKKLLPLLLLLITIAGAAEFRVLVTDVESNGLDNAQTTMIRQRVSEEIGKSPIFKTISRSEMEAIMMEVEYQQSGMVSDAELVELGKHAGVEYLVVGSANRSGDLYMLSLRMVSMKTSEAKEYTEKSNGSFESFVSDVVSKVVDELEAPIAHSLFGSLLIKSEPAGAKVQFNRMKLGTTPVSTGFQKPGSYEVVLRKDNYGTLTDTVTIALGDGDEKLFKLALDEAYTKEQKGSARKAKMKKRRPFHIGFGLLGLGGLAAGLVLDGKVKDESQKRDGLVATYTATKETKSATALGTQIDGLNSDINDKASLRNIMYGVAGAGALGLTITIVF